MVTPAAPVKIAPLDPFVVDFLRWLDAQPNGFASSADGANLAAALAWPEAFVEVVFTSTRVRRLIQPVKPGGSHSRTRWTLSASGRAWLQRVGPLLTPGTLA